MEKIWLKHYPDGVPALVRTDRYASLLALLDEGFRKHAALPAYKCMGRSYSFGDFAAASRALASLPAQRIWDHSWSCWHAGN